MNRMNQFRAHMFVAGAAAVFGIASVTVIHVPLLAYVNAVIFGANAAAAYLVRP